MTCTSQIASICRRNTAILLVLHGAQIAWSRSNAGGASGGGIMMVPFALTATGSGASYWSGIVLAMAAQCLDAQRWIGTCAAPSLRFCHKHCGFRTGSGASCWSGIVLAMAAQCLDANRWIGTCAAPSLRVCHKHFSFRDVAACAPRGAAECIVATQNRGCMDREVAQPVRQPSTANFDAQKDLKAPCIWLHPRRDPHTSLDMPRQQRSALVRKAVGWRAPTRRGRAARLLRRRREHATRGAIAADIARFLEETETQKQGNNRVAP